MSERLYIYFVETNAYNESSSGMDLVEYFRFESGTLGKHCEYDYMTPIHHTVVALAII